jgi:MFS family permease
MLISFAESFATIMVERGAYFYSHRVLNFSDSQNLWLALGIGVAYVTGALLSHRITKIFGERKLLLLVLAAHVILHLGIACSFTPAMFVVITLALQVFVGLKWPIIESYVSAGLDEKQTARAVGLFSIAWSAAVPLCMICVDPLINSDPPAPILKGSPMFFLAAAVNIFVLLFARKLEAAPVHTPHDHPDRPDANLMFRYKQLLASSRWSMISGYALLLLVVPLLPTRFTEFGHPEHAATLAAVVEFVRAATFIGMQQWSGWHNRAKWLVFVAIGLPVGFFMMLFGQHLTTVLLGEFIFGVAGGMAYYAALYYAMVVANASVESGGAHEGLIGAGFTVGPGLGLVGKSLDKSMGGPIAGMLAGVGPALALGTFAALWPLRIFVRKNPYTRF